MPDRPESSPEARPVSLWQFQWHDWFNSQFFRDGYRWRMTSASLLSVQLPARFRPEDRCDSARSQPPRRPACPKPPKTLHPARYLPAAARISDAPRVPSPPDARSTHRQRVRAISFRYRAKQHIHRRAAGVLLGIVVDPQYEFSPPARHRHVLVAGPIQT